MGLQALTKAAPDGSTLAVVSNNVVIFPSVIKALPFDMPGDFTPIAMVGSTPIVLVVNPPKVAATNGREFIALLKSKPDGLNFASGGTGTILHLAAEMSTPCRAPGVGGNASDANRALAGHQGCMTLHTIGLAGGPTCLRAPIH